MNNLQYYAEKIAPPGSDWYYSLLGTNPSLRELFLILLALDAEWRDILSLVQDQQVVQAKLTWWQQELERTFTQSDPQHPLMRLLLKSVEENYVDKLALQSDLNKLINAYIDRINPLFYSTQAEWLTQSLAQNNIYAILSKLVSESANADMALGMFLADKIIHLRAYLKTGEIPFSQEDVNHFSIDLSLLQTLKNSDALVNLLQHYQKIACDQLLKFYRDKSQNKILRRYAKLQYKLLQEICRDNFPVLQYQIVLPPLRKLFIIATV